MFRSLLLVVAIAGAMIGFGAGAHAASEDDRRDCSAHTNVDRRVEACTNVLSDQGSSVALRNMAFRNRGSSYGGQSLHELAILDLDEALKLSPDDVSARIFRAYAYYRSGKQDRAIADYTEALRLSPRNERAFNERGLARLAKGELDTALADFDEAVKINPLRSVPWSNRGTVFARQGKFDEAIAAYDEALRLEPRNLLALSNRGQAREEKGQFDQALADYKEAVEKRARPRAPDDQRAKAIAKKRFDRLTAAIADGKTTPKAVVVAERRVALIIGNGDYEHTAALRNPVNDAKALAEVLRKLGFSEVRELYNAKLSALGSALKDFGDLADGADWAVIYYAGHGIEMGGTNYLIPIDAKLEQQTHIDDEALPLSRLLGKVVMASKLQLVILDACRNNPFVPRMRMSAARTRGVGQGLASIEPEAGVLVAYAARDGTTALDGEATNSPYAEALIRHLAEPGLEISLLFRKVRDDVYTRTARQQEPFTYGSLPAQPFYFRR